MPASSDDLRLVVFDYDGTLVDSLAGLHESLVAGVRAVGGPDPDLEATRGTIGVMVPVAARALVPGITEAGIETFHKAMSAEREAQRKSGRPQDGLLPGALEVLKVLAGEDHTLLAIATNKSRKGLDYSLSYHGIASYFLTSRTVDEAAPKPHPEMIEQILAEAGVDASRAVMIGDTTVDMELAAHAGVAAIGVSWGYHAPGDLRGTGAREVAERFADLPAMIGRILA